MFKFAIKHMMVRRARVLLVMLSIVISASVALLSFNIAQQVSEGIISTAAYYDIIVGPAGSATQLAMNTMFFTDAPLGTIDYAYVEELQNSGMVNQAVPFTMGDSYNGAAIVGTTPDFLEGRKLKSGDMFNSDYEAVVGSAVASKYGIALGDSLVTSHGLSAGGSEHGAAPLKVVGILQKTGTAYDNAIFTGYETVWATHGSQADSKVVQNMSASRETLSGAPAHGVSSRAASEGGDEAESEFHEEAAGHDHGESGEICAILVKSKSFNDYYRLMEHYGDNASLLCINPATVLREVLDQVDMSAQIVYILCGVILLMNLMVISVITLLNMYDAQKEIALMRLIGVGMKRIGQLYLIENGIMGLMATLISLAISHGGLALMNGWVSSMGIVLNATKIYGLEWAILAVVFVISVLPTMLRIGHMAKRDGVR